MSEVRVMPTTIDQCPTCSGSGTLAYPEPGDCYDCAGSGLYVYIDAGDPETVEAIVSAAENQEER